MHSDRKIPRSTVLLIHDSFKFSIEHNVQECSGTHKTCEGDSSKHLGPSFGAVIPIPRVLRIFKISNRGCCDEDWPSQVGST